MQIPRPHRPKVRDPRANAILDWAETCAYVFWLVFAAIVGVMILLHGWDFAVRFPIDL